MGLATLLCQARHWATGAVLSGVAIVWAAGAVVLYLALRAGKRYRRIYGEVEQRHPLHEIFTSDLRSLVVWGAVDLWNGLALFAGWWRQGRPIFRAYAAVLGLLLLGLAIVGPFSASAAPLVGLPASLFLCGAVLILVGLLDHRQLARALKWLRLKRSACTITSGRR
jgi:hypothetical protein